MEIDLDTAKTSFSYRSPKNRLRKTVVSVFLAAALSGCAALPNDGPIASEIVAASANDGESSFEERETLFDLVDVTAYVAETTSRHKSRELQETFGLGNGSVSPRIGVGDTLQITIFEAGPDGLFSTTDSKSTSLQVVVQPDGNAAIPYVGSFQFAGNTLEAARRGIVGRLQSRAVEPDVIIALSENASRTVAVNGAVGKPSVVPLGLTPQRIMDVLAVAGGPSGKPYESYITLTRKGKTGRALIQRLISDPSENIYAQPGDQLFVAEQPQTFSVLGSSGRSAKIPFEAETVNLIEAAALAGGANGVTSDAKGFFVFRYEYKSVLKDVLGETRFAELTKDGLDANADGLYPIVYRIDLRKPSNYLIGQSFNLRDKDVLYVSRHPAADFIKFTSILSSTLGVARTTSTAF